MATIERVDNNTIKIYDGSPVRVKKTGNIVEIRTMEAYGVQSIQKLDKDNYVVLNTGELKQFNHTETRAESPDNVKQSMNALRDIINTNCVDYSKILFITLTYAENMQNQKQLYTDLKKFHQRLRYYLGEQKFEYISAIEPQGRGAFHAHELLIFDKKAPFIPNKKLAEIWGKGFTKITNVKNIDNLGLYLTAYLCDIDISEANIKDIKDGKRIKTIASSDGGETKKIIKGGRIKYYPRGFRFYRCSRGIKRPTLFSCSYATAQKMVESHNLTYEKTIKISSEGYRNIINYKTYTKPL